jgi:hypothetical protein
MATEETTVIRAVPGQPFPEPPHGGTWSRDPVTGDLTLLQTTRPPTDEERQALKDKQLAKTAVASNARADDEERRASPLINPTTPGAHASSEE